MRRACIIAGLAIAIGALAVLGYSVYAKTVTDALIHLCGYVIGGGLVLAALMAEPQTILGAADRLLAARKGGSNATP